MPRLVYIDVLKGLAIIGIVLQHEGFNLITENLHVPVFFMISGYFFKEEEMDVIVRRKFISLIVPYFWFVFLFFLIKWLFNYFDGNDIFFSLKSTIYSANPFKCNNILHKSIWFLPVLFFMSVIYRGIRYIEVERIVFLIVLLICALGYVIGRFWHIHVIYLSDTILSSVIYFHIGYYIKKNEQKADRVSWLALSIPIIFWTVLTLTLQPEHSYKNNLFPLYLPMMVIPAIASIFFLLKRMKLEGNVITKTFQIAGVYSLGILGYHALCNIVMDDLKIGSMLEVESLPYFRLLVIVLIVPFFVFLTLCISPRLIGKTVKVK